MKYESVEERQVAGPLESVIKRQISIVKTNKALLKEKKAELEEVLLQEKDYADAVYKVKLVSKMKKEAKEKAIESQMCGELVADIKDLQQETKEKQLSLFEGLFEFNRQTGKKEITDDTGETHYIELEAKIKI